jgi:hypothetical protein
MMKVLFFKKNIEAFEKKFTRPRILSLRYNAHELPPASAGGSEAGS